MAPTGVEVHNGKIRIWFIYRGVRCREILKGWATTGTNIKKAGQLRAKITSEIQLGSFDYALQFPSSKNAKKFSTTVRINTFEELCTAFVETKELEMTYASLRNMQSAIKTLIALVGSKTLIADIQQMDILRYRKSLLLGTVNNDTLPHLNKTGRAPATVNEQIRILCAMLKFAKSSHVISHSPFDDIASLKLAQKVPDPLSREEYDKFITILPLSFRYFWQVAFFTGMRHGELCALGWDDVDFESGKVNVSRNLNNYDQFGPPKTASGVRSITLLKPAVEALRAQFELTGKDQPTEITFHHREYSRLEMQQVRFVFRPIVKGRIPNPYYSKNALAYSWKQGFRKAGVRSRVPYQSRHTYACWSLSAGAIPSFIASQMGHKNASMVYRIYAKWMSEEDQGQISMLNSKLC
ncbi:site-specific integrase [Kosakonia sp. ML.JS2a]|uniref:site-specific integrase n=1 Tax=Kosakonia sp. ML.JS2a TaxID=2980557 RepID=UPI0029539456|nr:site-specific integrase [Kosakonia sp. ML.JS2a]